MSSSCCCIKGSNRVAPNSVMSQVEPESCGPRFSEDYGDYITYQTIGMGFFGAVDIKLCLHQPTEEPVVVREYDLESLTHDQLREVQNEVVLSRSLSHPNVACYACCFVWNQKLWALQPLMHYGSCADVMHSAQRFQNGFSEKMISVILRDIIEGLQYLHNLSLVHRSIRAKHFLISSSGHVKLSGLRTMIPMMKKGERVRTLHQHSSATTENICWLAPEVLAQDAEGYTTKSDIYSIGMAALELATGEAPFAGLPVTEIFMLKLHGHPPLLLKKQPDLSKHFSELVDKSVVYTSANRPSASKLLTFSFLKSRTGPLGESILPELLRPVMPLDHTKLTLADSNTEDVRQGLAKLTVSDAWSF